MIRHSIATAIAALTFAPVAAHAQLFPVAPVVTIPVTPIVVAPVVVAPAAPVTPTILVQITRTDPNTITYQITYRDGHQVYYATATGHTIRAAVQAGLRYRTNLPAGQCTVSIDLDNLAYTYHADSVTIREAVQAAIINNDPTMG